MTRIDLNYQRKHCPRRIHSPRHRRFTSKISQIFKEQILCNLNCIELRKKWRGLLFFFEADMMIQKNNVEIENYSP